MSKVYLFPCPECNQSMPVELRQAGNLLTCPGCKSESEAPKLRELRQLPPVKPDSETSVRPRKRIRRGMFAMGLGLALITGIAGTALYLYSANLLPDQTPEEIIALQGADIDKSQAVQVYSLWEMFFEDRHKIEWQETQLRSDTAQGEYLRILALGLLAICGVGVILVVASVAFPARRR